MSRMKNALKKIQGKKNGKSNSNPGNQPVRNKTIIVPNSQNPPSMNNEAQEKTVIKAGCACGST